MKRCLWSHKRKIIERIPQNPILFCAHSALIYDDVTLRTIRLVLDILKTIDIMNINIHQSINIRLLMA